MKRAAPDDNGEDDWVQDPLVGRLPANTRGSVYAVVRGPVMIGLFNDWTAMLKIKADRVASGAVYAKFDNHAAASAWFEAAQRLPVYGPSARVLEVHVSGRYYDVTQDRDYEGAVAVYFGRGDRRNLRMQAGYGPLDTTVLRKALDILAATHPVGAVRIISDCYELVYGINYGLWTWPKRTICEPRDAIAKTLRDDVRARGIELVWSKDRNYARVLATSECESQCYRSKPDFRTVYNRKKRVLLFHLLYRRSRFPRDIAMMITQILKVQSRYVGLPLGAWVLW